MIAALVKGKRSYYFFFLLFISSRMAMALI